jgi:hypothetical protein
MVGATQTSTSGPNPVTTQSNEGLVDKKAIASRYGISLRKVDYLREQKILPWYELPPRCIRFKPNECDAILARYRRGGVKEEGSRREKRLDNHYLIQPSSRTGSVITQSWAKLDAFLSNKIHQTPKHSCSYTHI